MLIHSVLDIITQPINIYIYINDIASECYISILIQLMLNISTQPVNVTQPINVKYHYSTNQC